MKEASKPPNSSCTVGDLRVIVGLVRTRRTKAFLYGLALAFVAFTAYMAFCPSNNASPWFNNLFASASVSTAPYRSQISSIFTYIFPNSSAPSPSPRNPTPSPQNLPADGGGDRKGGILAGNLTSVGGAAPERGGSSAAMNQTATGIGLLGSGVAEKNSSVNGAGFKGIGDSKSNQTTMGGEEDSKAKDGAAATKATVLASKNQTASGEALKNKNASSVDLSKGTDLPTKKQVNMTAAASPHKIQSFNAADSAKNRDDEMDSKEAQAPTSSEITAETNQSSGGVSSITKISASTPAKTDKKGASASSDSLLFGNGSAGPPSGDVQGSEQVDWVSAMEGCDIFQGRWVKDDSYPLYPEGSCPHIDEPFDCYRNGRTDRAYQKLRWQPNGCNIPRLNATDMLERLRGKRLVFVGDSLNRNMWESLVCILRNSINDKSKVFEASGRHEFRTEGSYSFVFKDFNCSVEYFRSPFLVEEGEMPESNGKEKETLRLDTIEKASARYKDADVVIFNTGHWWTHEKTSKGKDYYQEGNHIYSELNVVEAFHIALNTWAKWVDANVNPSKSLVFFRGYSASHFKGGQWNSGGQCDKETEPIKEEKYLSSYPWKMSVLESVIKGMKSPVSYMNITRMTDYRKDAHPSIYRKQNLTEEERRAPERFQDCSHWCLPGVPDSWNELLYAQLISKQHRMVQERANQH